MSNISRMIAKEMAKSGGKAKMIRGNIVSNISPDVEWLKWLSYEPEFEKRRIEYLNSKTNSKLSDEELKEVNKYRKNKLFAKLFKIYGTSKCSEKEYMMVYDYMCTESINNLMISKLTSCELQYAKNEINRLSKIPKEELDKKITREEKTEIYKQLSMVDSYIFHFISNIKYNRNMDTFNKEITSQTERNEAIRRKSLI